MDRASEITRGAIATIFKTGEAKTGPIVQIVELKKIAHSNSNPNAPPRYRLAISDGTHFQQAMIATQLNVLISEQKLTLYCLVRVKEVICNSVQLKKIVIILNLEVVAPLPAKVGNPISVDIAMAGGGQKQSPGYLNQNGPPTNAIQDMKSSMGGYGQGGDMQAVNVQNTYGNNANNMTVQPGMGQNQQMKAQSSFGGSSWNAAPQNSNNQFSGNAGFVSKMNTSPMHSYRPIQSINPYQNGWTIRGRCTFKSDMRTYQNARGEGQVISFELTDESGSIRVTAFTQHAPMVEKTVQLSNIYSITRGSLKQANEKYNRSTSSFEMTLDRNSVLTQVEDDGSFVKVNYKFVKIGDLERVDVKGSCDVLGIVTLVAPASEIIIRSTGEPCLKRSIQITDDSNKSVELTVWRKQAESFLTENDVQRHPVLLIRNASRGDFGGVCLNISRQTSLELDPVNVPEANKLRAWFDAGGLNGATVQSMTSGSGGAGGKVTGPRKSLEAARIEDVAPIFSGGSGSGATTSFVTRAVIAFVNTKNDMYYPGDPETKKKVISQGSGLWSSESTGRQLTDEEVVWRYIISMKVLDFSSSKWVSGFDEIGVTIFGRTARELRDLKARDEAMYESIIEDVTFRPMVMKVQVKENVWKDEQKIRYTISRAELVDFSSEGHLLLSEIASYGGM